jgi:hypothetical protein
MTAGAHLTVSDYTMTRNPLSTPDLCAHLDRLKSLCDGLEYAQRDPDLYRNLVAQIRMETEAFRALVCGASADTPSHVSADIRTSRDTQPQN